MSRKAHRDNELKPPAKALVALKQWLDENGLRQVALVKPLGSQQSRVTRLFAGETYLSATERRAIEAFTEGAITAAMLEGKAVPPTKVEARRFAPAEPPVTSAVPRAPAAEEAGGPGGRTGDDAERIVDGLAAKAMPAAFKVIIEQMVKGKTESERRRCAEILIEHLRGKARQYEKREKLVQPVSDEALLRKLREIEANLTGLPVDQHGRVIRTPPAGAPKETA
jgi:predicted XRE-type DNA-binding protein